MVMCYEATDSSGEPVFTEYSGAMLRDVTCTDGGRALDGIPEIARKRIRDEQWGETIPLHPLAAHIYDGCADIHYPIHSSPQFAQAVGLPGIIVQGTATLAYAVTAILSKEAGGDPALLTELDGMFAGMVEPGTPIHIAVREIEPAPAGRDVHFDVLNHAGQKAVTGGRARLRR